MTHKTRPTTNFPINLTSFGKICAFTSWTEMRNHASCTNNFLKCFTVCATRLELQITAHLLPEHIQTQLNEQKSGKKKLCSMLVVYWNCSRWIEFKRIHGEKKNKRQPEDKKIVERVAAGRRNLVIATPIFIEYYTN